MEAHEVFAVWEVPTLPLYTMVVTSKDGVEDSGRVMGYIAWEPPMLMYAVIKNSDQEMEFFSRSEVRPVSIQ